MDFLSILLIALGLAMDAFAVSIASGVAIKSLKMENAFRIATFFGLFQAIMPIIGWLAGLTLRPLISSFDHWVALLLLSLIGGKMIYESFRLGEPKTINPLNFFVLFMLAIATSIDALAVGLSLSFLRISIAFPVIVIGIVTFALSLIGVFIGNRVGHFFEKRLEFIGGLILIGIGIKILIEHIV